MMKLDVGQSVYYIAESFNPYHFRIAKCKVKSIPHDGLKEYCLLENGHMYWCQRKYIYDTYSEAVKQADRETDEYEKRWSRMIREKLLRPWRKYEVDIREG